MTTRLITILSAYTGAWGRPVGGLCGCNPGAGPYVDNRLVTRPDFRKKPGRRVNINEIARLYREQGREAHTHLLCLWGYPVASVCCQKGMEDYCAQIYLRWSMSGS